MNTQRETGILRPMRYAETQRTMRKTSMVRKQASADKSGRKVSTRPLSTAATSDLRSEHSSDLQERRVNVRIVRKRTLRTKKMTSSKLAPKMTSSKLALQRRLEERPPMRACATNNVRDFAKKLRYENEDRHQGSPRARSRATPATPPLRARPRRERCTRDERA